MSERVNAYNERRKERFVAAGINETNIAEAVMSFVGEGGPSCALCDHEILYEFALEFPSKAVRFYPVGSNCITNWIEAMPESPEKTAARERLAAAERLKDELVARKRAEQEAAKRRTAMIERLAPQDRALLARYHAIPKSNLESADPESVKALEDISEKLVRFGNFASDRQRGYFSVKLREVEGSSRGGRPTPPPPARPSTPPNASPRPTATDHAVPPSAREVGAFPVPECPLCRGETRVRSSARGPFFGCARYPACKGIINVWRPQGQQELPFSSHGSPASASPGGAPAPTPEAVARARQAAQNARTAPTVARTFRPEEDPGDRAERLAEEAREREAEREHLRHYGTSDETPF